MRSNCSIDSPPEDAAIVRERVRTAIGLISGKWKLEIMWLLTHRKYRFNELRRAIPGVTQHMLTAQLRELEAGGLVIRRAFPEIPPRVEYEIADDALRLRPVFDALLHWALDVPSGSQADTDPAC